MQFGGNLEIQFDRHLLETLYSPVLANDLVPHLFIIFYVWNNFHPYFRVMKWLFTCLNKFGWYKDDFDIVIQ